MKINLLTHLAQAGFSVLAFHHHTHGHHTKAIALIVLALLSWLISHLNLNTRRASEYLRGLNSKRMVFSLVVPFFLAALLAGCAIKAPGRIISIDEHGFGINLSQNPANQTPQVKLGFFSSRIVLEPVFTNAQVSVPAFGNTFALDDTGSPFTFGVNETFASGDYESGDPMFGSSNGVALLPVIPSAVNTNYSAETIRAALEAQYSRPFNTNGASTNK